MTCDPGDVSDDSHGVKISTDVSDTLGGVKMSRDFLECGIVSKLETLALFEQFPVNTSDLFIVGDRNVKLQEKQQNCTTTESLDLRNKSDKVVLVDESQNTFQFCPLTTQ